MKGRWNRRGFGLVELLFVVAILAVIAYFLLPHLLGGKDALTQKKIMAPKQRAEQVVGVTYTYQINQAIQMYRGDHDGQNPPDLAGLKAYGVTDEMMLDPVTHQPLTYDAQTGVVGNAAGANVPLGGQITIPQQSSGE
jgi:prepilin-type N-terminal cleavage/methylation domain-containing protein